MARSAPGVLAAVAAAAAFSSSGALLKPLLEAGWSPAAAVAVRVAVGGSILAVPALVLLRGDLRPLLTHWRLIVGYGLIAVAGTQVLYFASIQRLPVAVALLVQYSAPLLVVAFELVRDRRPPTVVIVVGSVLSITGMVLVVQPTGGHGDIDAGGLALAIAAAVCLAGYYLISARPSPGLPPLALAGSGLLVGSAAILVVGATGLLPLSAGAADVTLGGRLVPWWVPLLVVAVVGTAAAYALSLAGARRLGSRVASFLGLTEVLFAVLLAWALLGERPSPAQLIGGACVLAGVVLAKLERPAEVRPLEPGGPDRAGRGESPARTRGA